MVAARQKPALDAAGRHFAGGFALALRIDAGVAGRAYAAYGGIYILSSLLWLWLVENTRPDHWDMIGAMRLLAGRCGSSWRGPRNS